MDILDKFETFRGAAESVANEMAYARKQDGYSYVDYLMATVEGLGIVPVVENQVAAPSENLSVSDEVKQPEVNQLEKIYHMPSAPEANYQDLEPTANGAVSQTVDPVTVKRSDEEIQEMQKLHDEAQRLIDKAHGEADV